MFHLVSTESNKITAPGFDRPAVEPQLLPDPVLVRRATAADEPRIRVLALLDNRRTPAGPYLLAELGGEPVAAISLTSGELVANPFRHTGDAAELLRMRAAQLAESAARFEARRARTALKPAAA